MSRRKRNYRSGKMFRKGGSKILNWLLGILAVVLACACVFGIFGGGSSFGRERNEDNLIEIGESSGYIESQNTGRGVEIKVKEDGTIKLSGKSTSNWSVTVATLSLAKGTYTLSGLQSELGEFSLSAVYGDGDIAYSGTDSDTFTLDAAGTVVIQLSWDKDHTFNVFTGNTVRPVLVSGDKPGEFYG